MNKAGITGEQAVKTGILTTNSLPFVQTDQFRSADDQRRAEEIREKIASESEAPTNIYNYLNQIDRVDLFRYMVMFIGFSLFVNRLNFSFSGVVAMLVAVFLIYFDNERTNALGRNFNLNMESKILGENFKWTRNFYMDSDLIQFVDRIQEYKRYNKTAFYKMIWPSFRK